MGSAGRLGIGVSFNSVNHLVNNIEVGAFASTNRTALWDCANRKIPSTDRAWALLVSSPSIIFLMAPIINALRYEQNGQDLVPALVKRGTIIGLLLLVTYIALKVVVQLLAKYEVGLIASYPSTICR